MNTTDPSGYEYYSEWYINDLNYAESEWTEGTPWCACFLSWALKDLGTYLNGDVPRYANVDIWYKTFTGSYFLPKNTASTNIRPGDLIFFSWDNDQNDLEHVGAVFAVEDNWVYTIEGNSGDVVALRRYPLNDESIMGYGVLNWK